MKITIVIPVYNVQDYIIECLDSVANQDYNALECILVDDCSTDDSARLATHWINSYQGEKKFNLITLPYNSGASAARNKGIQKANGDYIYFLDADDKLLAQSISTLVQTNGKYGNVDLVHGEFLCENPQLLNDFSLSKKNIPVFSKDHRYIKTILFTEFPISPCNKLIKLSLIKDHQLYFKEGITNEDVLWIFRLRQHITSYALEMQPTYFYRSNSNSVMTSSANEKRRILSYTYVLKELIQGIDTSILFWDNLAIVRHFEHNRKIKIYNQENLKLFESEFTSCIQAAIDNKNVLLRFKPLYYWLKLKASSFEKTNFLFKKYLGILYRLK